jgi:hypothetical protein
MCILDDGQKVEICIVNLHQNYLLTNVKTVGQRDATIEFIFYWTMLILPNLIRLTCFKIARTLAARLC